MKAYEVDVGVIPKCKCGGRVRCYKLAGFVAWIFSCDDCPERRGGESVNDARRN